MVKKNPFRIPEGVFTTYSRSLKKIAEQAGEIIKAYANKNKIPSQSDIQLMRIALDKYSDLIDRWSYVTAQNMLNEVEKRNRNVWKSQTKELGAQVRNIIEETPVGSVMKGLLAEQVFLIKSIPIEAGQRVHELAIEAMSQGTRAKDIAEMIYESNEVSKSRAMLIARTEIGRADVTLTEARATRLGSEGYIWRTAHDYNVRPSHRMMEGKFVRWDDPPAINEGSEQKPNIIRHHAGAIWNCRCFASPQIPGLEMLNAA